MLLVTWRQTDKRTFSQTLEGTAKGPILLIHPGSAFFTGPPREMAFWWLRISSWWQDFWHHLLRTEDVYFLFFQVRFRLQVQFVACVPVPEAGQGFRASTVLFPSVRHPVASLESLKSVASFLMLMGILFLSELHAFLLLAFMVTFRKHSGWDVITSSSPDRGS